MSDILYPYASPEEAGLSAGLTDAIDRMTAEDIADGLVTCAAIRIVCRNKTVYHKNHGFADEDKTVPLNDFHLFRIIFLIHIFFSG